MAELVLRFDKSLNVSDEGGKGEKEFVGEHLVFEMFPKALNHIQVGGVRRQPTDEDTRLKKAEKGLDEMAVMKRRIVQDQHQRLGRIVHLQKLFQEGQKGEGILGRCSLQTDLSRTPVVRAKEVNSILRTPRGGQTLLAAAPHPAGAHGKLQAHGAFVQIE